jgi:hypothetical protein
MLTRIRYANEMMWISAPKRDKFYQMAGEKYASKSIAMTEEFPGGQEERTAGLLL